MQVNHVLTNGVRILLFLSRNNKDYPIYDLLKTKEKYDSTLAIFSSVVSLKLLLDKKNNLEVCLVLSLVFL